MKKIKVRFKEQSFADFEDSVRSLLDKLRIKKYEVISSFGDVSITIYSELPLAVFSKISKGLSELGLRNPNINGSKGCIVITADEPHIYSEAARNKVAVKIN